MGSLKDFAKLRSKPNPNQHSNGDDSNTSVSLNAEFNKVKLSYFESGYGDSKSSMGKPSVLVKCMRNLYEGYKDKCRREEEDQVRLKQPYLEEQSRLKTEIDRKETYLEIKNEEIERINEEIRQFDANISEANVDPQKFGITADKRPKAQFYIGMVVLLPITLYLLVFYISASYSAFFKEFDTGKLTAAIFDAQALSKAHKDGWLELVFVSTIPFAFMGLGYLIHMFQKANEKLKIFALFLVTFIFDAILAYQIDKKVYDFNKNLTSPEFNFQAAIESISFWGIIFAGFVVYIIWGLVFDFIMKEYENLDKVEKFINKLREQKDLKMNFKENLQKEINEVKEDIVQIRGKVKELQSKIDGFIFPKQKYLVLHAEYTKGWFLAITKELALPHKEKNSLISECEVVDREYLENLSLNSESHENIIYQ